MTVLYNVLKRDDFSEVLWVRADLTEIRGSVLWLAFKLVHQSAHVSSILVDRSEEL